MLLARFHLFVLLVRALLGKAVLLLARIALLRFTPRDGTLASLLLRPARIFGAIGQGGTLGSLCVSRIS